MACLFANIPTNLSPLFEIATTEGVSLEPSLFSKTLGTPASTIAATELVVPRSIPIILFILVSNDFYSCRS
jgi:hypothetical protein